VAKDDVGELAFAVGHTHGEDDAAVVHGPNLEAVGIGERVQADGPPVVGAERLFLDSVMLWRSSLSQDAAAERESENNGTKQGHEASGRHSEKSTTGELMFFGSVPSLL